MKTYTFKNTLHACYQGYVTQAIINNLAPLLFVIFQKQYQLSYEQVGRLILINFTTQIIADIITARYGDRIGYRRAAVGAHLFCGVGLIVLGVLPLIFPGSYLCLVIAVMIYAFGGGIIEVLISPIAESLPGDAKAATMSLLHSFYSWGQVTVVLVTTLLLQLIGSNFWFVLPLFWSIIPLINAIKFTRVPLVELVAEAERLPGKQLLKTQSFGLALLLMLAAGASELSMSQWSSLFAEQGLGVPKVIGDLLGPCLFAVFMGIGRTLYGFYGERIKLEKALFLSGIFCIICYAITIFSPNPFLSLLGCALCGLSVSLMWPGTLSLTAKTIPRGGTLMFGFLAIFGDLGAASGPWITGVVSDLTTRFANFTPLYSLKTGLTVAMVFPALIVTSLWLAKRKTEKQSIA